MSGHNVLTMRVPDCMLVIGSDQSSQGTIQGEEHKQAKLYLDNWGEKITCALGVALLVAYFYVVK